MRMAIMQPYFFPYIGYFQLIYATDIFVFYDDVNFINRGWINRNRILINGKDQLITVPCKDASQNKMIKEVELLNDPKSFQKLLSTVTMAYKKAPFFNEVYPIIENTLQQVSDISISELAIRSVEHTCEYLGLDKVFKVSSQEYNNRELKKADRLIDICHLEGVVNYINPSGGKEIYTKDYYRARGIDLEFLTPVSYEYVQFKNSFVPWLSIIDVLMFNSKEEMHHKILPSYYLD